MSLHIGTRQGDRRVIAMLCVEGILVNADDGEGNEVLESTFNLIELVGV